MLEVLRAFVVKNMKFGGVAVLMNQEYVSLFPGMSDAGAFAIRDSNRVNGIGVLMVEDE